MTVSAGLFEYKAGLSGDGWSYIVYSIFIPPWRLVEKGGFASMEEAQAWADQKNAVARGASKESQK